MAEKSKVKQTHDLTYWLKKINFQLERLIVCQEKKLEGKVLTDFDSAKEVKNA